MILDQQGPWPCVAFSGFGRVAGPQGMSISEGAMGHVALPNPCGLW